MQFVSKKIRNVTALIFSLIISLCAGQLQVERFTLEEESGPQLVGVINIPDGTIYRLVIQHFLLILVQKCAEYLLCRVTQHVSNLHKQYLKNV